MNITKIASLCAGAVLSVTSLSAMEMMDKGTSSMMKDDMKKSGVMMHDTMMKDDSMKKSATVASDMMMLEKVTAFSSKEDIAKVQMMLVEKGYLVMPEGVAYGYYGKRTKAAFTKYKKMSMMMKDGMKKDAMMKDTMMKKDTMMNDGMKKDTMMKDGMNDGMKKDTMMTQ